MSRYRTVTGVEITFASFPRAVFTVIDKSIQTLHYTNAIGRYKMHGVVACHAKECGQKIQGMVLGQSDTPMQALGACWQEIACTLYLTGALHGILVQLIYSCVIVNLLE